MGLFPLTGQPLVADLDEKKKIQILKEFALLKEKQTHFKWVAQTMIPKLSCEQIKHLIMKQCSLVSFITRDFSPQAICSIMWQLTQAEDCFWIPFQRSQPEPTAICKGGWIFLKARCYLLPSIFSTTSYVCMIVECKNNSGAEEVKVLLDTDCSSISLSTPCSSSKINQEKLQLRVGYINYFVHGNIHMETIFPGYFSSPDSYRHA